MSPTDDQSKPTRSAAPLERLKKRVDFQWVSRGKRDHAAPFTLLHNARDPAAAAKAGPRLGFTVTKKIGNSVIRNRIRRRLREAVRLAPDLATSDERDYVLMAKREALGRDFDRLLQDVRSVFMQAQSASAGKSAERKPRASTDHRDQRQ